jgi:cytochrome c-type biogenesis protein CcmF
MNTASNPATLQYIGEHLLPGQFGYFFTLLSLVASLVASFSFAKAFYANHIDEGLAN